MAPLSWPSTLPVYPLLGTTGRFGTTGLRTAMEAGPAKQRRRFTAATQSSSRSFVLDTAQWQTLETFWRVTTAGGTLRFSARHPVTGAAADYRFVANQPPEWEQIGPDHYRVTIQLEEMP
ncbi:hypothetical protein [Oleisolibacter albus]|uniref:hypothetical protein n=1 Tax=Oleisolibacter albus TaxID=2171757 RepID=UPI000DF164A0|nr:hypothetical protein [Oleisolibacter albus]